MNYFSTTPGTNYSSTQFSNVGLTVSVGSNAMTLNMTSVPTNTQMIVGFRNATATSGSYNTRTLAAGSAPSLTVPASATLGTASAVQAYLYVYAIDATAIVGSTTVEVAISQSVFDEGVVQSTTAISSSSNSNAVMYSTTARANVPVRLIGRLTSTQTTAGTWATAPSVVTELPFLNQAVVARYTSNSTAATPDVATTFNFSTKSIDTHTAVTTGGSWVFTCPVAGFYEISSRIQVTGNAVNAFNTNLRKNGSNIEGSFTLPQEVASSFTRECQHYALASCAVGDTLDVQFWETVNNSTFGGNATVTIRKITGIA